MSVLAEPLDRLLRALMRVPGAVLDVVDGRVVVPEGPGPVDVYDDVRATARHPESRLALEPDLHYTRNGRQVLAWQHRGRTSFAVGGLNADPAQRDSLLRVHLVQTARLGIARQLLFPVRADELDAVRARGFSAVRVGVEAVVDLDDFTLRGGRFADVRQMVRRATRRGVWTEEVSPAQHADELHRIHADWLHSKRPSWRMKLLVGSPSLDRPFDRRYVIARTERRIEAFCTLLPSRPGVWGLDVMCRRPDAVAGSMERLLSDVALQLREEGASTLSLGANPMAGVPRGGDHPLLHGIFRLLYHNPLGDRVFGFRRLHQFKSKFRPREEPLWFAARPGLGVMALYRGCRMWGLY